MKNHLLFRLNDVNLRKLHRFYKLGLNCIEDLTKLSYLIGVQVEKTKSCRKNKLSDKFAIAPISKNLIADLESIPEFSFIRILQADTFDNSNIQHKFYNANSQDEINLEIIDCKVLFEELLYTKPKNTDKYDIKNINSVLVMCGVKNIEEILSLTLKFLNWDTIKNIRIATFAVDNKLKKYVSTHDKICLLEIPDFNSELLNILQHKFANLIIFKNLENVNYPKVYTPIDEELLLWQEWGFNEKNNELNFIISSCKPIISFRDADFTPADNFFAITKPAIVKTKIVADNKINFKVNILFDFQKTQNVEESAYLIVSRKILLKHWQIVSKIQGTQDGDFVPIKITDDTDVIFIFRSVILNLDHDKFSKSILPEAICVQEFTPGIFILQFMKFQPEPDKSTFLKNIAENLSDDFEFAENTDYLILPRLEIFHQLEKYRNIGLLDLPDSKNSKQQELLLHNLNENWCPSSQLQFYLNQNLFQTISLELENKFNKFRKS